MDDEYCPEKSLRVEVDRFMQTNTFHPLEVTHFYMQANLVLKDMERIKTRLINQANNYDFLRAELEKLKAENEKLKADRDSFIKAVEIQVDVATRQMMLNLDKPSRMHLLECVADAARALRVDGKGLSIMEANEMLDAALAALDAEGEGEK